MFTDPLFLFSLVGILGCLFIWIKSNVTDATFNPYIEDNLSSISTFFFIAMVMSIFYKSGDLGVILFIAVIICFAVFFIGLFFKNKEITKATRGTLIPLFLIFVLRSFVYEPYQIPSSSMLPGLKIGDFILVNKYDYGLKIDRLSKPIVEFNNPDYGDVVVFVPPHNPVPYIKRLIGKPGDSIKYINKKIYVNDELVIKDYEFTNEESITRRYKYPSGQIQEVEEIESIKFYSEKLGNTTYMTRNSMDRNKNYPQQWTVPDDHYFVVGDNRDNSNDSRQDVGFVPRNHFFGKAEYIWMSWECWTCLPNFERAGKIN
jgi:signal peptidase I